MVLFVPVHTVVEPAMLPPTLVGSTLTVAVCVNCAEQLVAAFVA